MHARMGRAYLFLRSHEKAVEWSRSALRHQNVGWPAAANLAATLGHLGRLDDVEKMSLRTRATFVHLPLATRQVANRNKEMASLPVATSASALHLIVGAISKLEPKYDPKLV